MAGTEINSLELKLLISASDEASAVISGVEKDLAALATSAKGASNAASQAIKDAFGKEAEASIGSILGRFNDVRGAIGETVNAVRAAATSFDPLTSALEASAAQGSTFEGVLGTLKLAASGGKEAVSALKDVVSQFKTEQLEDIATSNSYREAVEGLGRAIKFTGDVTEAIGPPTQNFAAQLAQAAQGAKLAEVALAEYSKRGLDVGPVDRWTGAQESARASMSASSEVTRLLRSAMASLDAQTQEAIASAKSFADLENAIGGGATTSGESLDALVDAITRVNEGFVQQATVTSASAAALKQIEKTSADAAAAQKTQAAEQKRADELSAKQKAVLEKAVKDYNKVLKENAKDSLKTATAAADAGEVIVRELGGAFVSVGSHLGRLGGITTTFAQTLGRQFVRGTGTATSGLGALLNRTQLVAKANSVYADGIKKATRLQGEEAEGAIKAAEELKGQTIAGIGVAASSAKMAIGLGAAAAAIAVVFVGAAGAAAALKSLSSAGIEVSRAFESTAIRSAASDLGGLKRAVFDISDTTGVKFDQLGAAMGRALLKVGGDASAAQQLLKVATDTALAAITSPETAVEHLGDVMRSYRLEIGEVKDVSNTLLILMRTGREDFDQLARGISALAPQAQKLGLTFKDVAANLAGIVKAGVPAQQAIFGLRSIFAELEREDAILSVSLRQIGIDVSETAFRTKGLSAVFLDMERGLRRSGLSLNKFLGESRRGPTLLAILEGAGKTAGQALKDMGSSADQAKEAIERLQNLPGRRITNFLNELNNLWSELGETLITFIQPTLKELIGFFHELNQLIRDYPQAVDRLVEVFKAFAASLVSISPVLSAIALELVALRGQLALGRQFLAGLRITMSALFPPTLKAADALNVLGIAAAALGGSLPRARVGLRSLAAQFTIPDSARDSIGAYQQQADALNLGRAIENAKAFVATFGNADEAFNAFAEALLENGEKLKANAAISAELRSAAEKHSDQTKELITTYRFFEQVLLSVGFATDVLVSRLERTDDELRIVQTGLDLSARASDRARESTKQLAEFYGLRGDAADKLRFALKGLAEQETALDELSTGGRARTGDDEIAVQKVIERIERTKEALASGRAAVDDFGRSFRTNLENAEIQLADMREEAARLAAEELPALAEAASRAADQFERLIVGPQREGFGGGFSQGIKEFIRQAQDSFQIGQEAAAEFASAFTSALQTMIASIGTGKTSLKSFAVAVLQSITQIIAKLLALRIAASVFSLFGGGGGGGTSTGPSGSPLNITGSGDTGGIKNFDLGGQAALSRGGINTRPTIFAAPLRAGMTEAFVPLPGPNRGIPVEFRNPRSQGDGGRGPMHFTINIASTSLDPRTAGDVIMQQIPLIVRGVAAAIDGRKDSILTAAIRGAGR